MNKKTIKDKRYSHGLSGHRLYDIWVFMIQRTSNPNCSEYQRYGGRGIEVCERWKDISNFIDDMYESYEEGLSIDRIDVNGNYEPSNCRWATKSTQQRNTRKIRANNTSGYRGVSLNKNVNKWVASIRVDGKKKSLGYFSTAKEAGIAYDEYVIKNNLEHTLNNIK